MEFILVTGLSGAGKSITIMALEDIGFYCVDNMPPKLLSKFVELSMESRSDKFSRVAIVADVRGGSLFDDLFNELKNVREMGIDYKILFLDCSDHVLAQRYKETRRQHPLVSDKTVTVKDAISEERYLLSALRESTDFLIDTTYLSTAQLKERVISIFLEEPTDAMMIQTMSFGFKYGYPAEADLMFDVRFLPNPFYVPELREKTGLDKEVRDYVRTTKMAIELEEKLFDFIDYLLPLYRDEGKSQLVIAIGCTGGKHRSVAIAEALAEHLTNNLNRVQVNHRDIQKL